MQTGLIGLGAMGTHMARNLNQAGMLCAIWNRSPEKASRLASEMGIAAAASPAELAAQCELIITCVSRDDDVLEVVGRLAPHLNPGSIVADTSTVSADTARDAATRLAGRGAGFLDCPVSGGVEGARNATLAMMVGGDAATLARARPALAAIAANIVHMGPAGTGQATKAVNQIMAAGINQAVTEALAFGQAMGLPMEKVIDVIGRGAAANWFLDHRGKSMVAGDFTPGFKVELHQKDLGICQSMAKAKGGLALPVVAMTLADYAALMAQGFGNEDISALYRMKHLS